MCEINGFQKYQRSLNMKKSYFQTSLVVVVEKKAGNEWSKYAPFTKCRKHLNEVFVNQVIWLLLVKSRNEKIKLLILDS